MTSISNAQHKAFLESVKKELILAGPLIVQEDAAVLEAGMEKSLQELEQLYKDYSGYLDKIQLLIRRYETKKKEARIQLRKLLAVNKNRSFKRTKIFNHNIGQAS